MSQFAPEDHQGAIDLVSDGDITFESDRNQDGSGDLVFRTAGIERARIKSDGSGAGVLGGAVTYLGASNGTDDSIAIQAAITSGNRVVGAHGVQYKIGAKLTLTGTADYDLWFNAKLNSGVNDSLISSTTTGMVKLRGRFDGNAAGNLSFPAETGLLDINGAFYADLDVYVTAAPQDSVIARLLTAGDIHVVTDTSQASGVVVIDSSYVNVTGKAKNVGSCGALIKPETQDCVGVNVSFDVDTCATIVTSGIGVYFNSGDTFIVRDSSMTDCHVTNAGYVGIFPGGDRNTLKGCVVEGSGKVTAASAHAYWIHDSAHVTVTNCVARDGARGGFTVGKAHDIAFNGCVALENAQHGFYALYDAAATGRYQGTATNKDISFTGCHSVNNSQSVGNTYSGFYNDGCSTVTYTGCQAHDYQVTTTQRRGLEAAASAATPSGMKVVNCDWSRNHQADGMSVTVTYLDHSFGNVGTTTYKLPASMRQSGKLVPTAAIRENFNRLLASADLTVLTSGTLRMQLIWLEAGDVVSAITFVSAATGATTPTHQWFALYDVSRNLLGQTSDDTATAWAADAAKTLSLSAAYTVPTSGYYYVGAMVAAATPPHLRGISSSADVTGLAPIASGNTADTGLTTTAPNPAAAPGPSGNVAYCYVG